MQNYICSTCGTQFDATETPPSNCPICDDERQYVGYNGQQWSTLDRIKRAHHNRIETIEKNLFGIGTEPTFGIGHRSLLVRSSVGNILWDPTFLLDETTLTTVRALGGIKWIAVSHPHLVTTCVEWSRAFNDAPIYWHTDNREWVMRKDGTYVFWGGETCALGGIKWIAVSHPHLVTTCVEWSKAFGDAPIYWHTDNREWVMRKDGTYVFWGGETCALGFGLTLVRCGGHFEGSTVLHWANGDEGRGALLAGDTIQVVSDRRYVSFMYSYPNQIPLNAQKVSRIVNAIEPYSFDKIYGGWWTSIVAPDAKNAVKRSAARYIRAIQ